jgi:hypothetical protein
MPVRNEGLQKHPKAAVGPQNLSNSIKSDVYVFETFSQEPFCYVKQPAAGTIAAPTGSTLTENIVDTGRYKFEFYFIAAQSDQLVPLLGTEGGYDWCLDADTLGDGVEINFGGLTVGHPRNWIPANRDDRFARILLIFDNASGVDAFFGVKKVAAPVTTLTEITDVVGVRILGTSDSSDANFTVITNLNNAGSTDYTSTATSITGLEDAVAVELEIRTVAGKAFLFVNGAPIAGAPTYTFDSGDSVCPIARLLQATDLVTQVKTLCYEAGKYPQDRTPASLISLATTTA